MVGSEDLVHRAVADADDPRADRRATGERRLAYRFQAVVQTLFPLVVISLGALVCFLAFAFFAPLVVLLRRLSG